MTTPLSWSKDLRTKVSCGRESNISRFQYAVSKYNSTNTIHFASRMNLGSLRLFLVSFLCEVFFITCISGSSRPCKLLKNDVLILVQIADQRHAYSNTSDFTGVRFMAILVFPWVENWRLLMGFSSLNAFFWLGCLAVTLFPLPTKVLPRTMLVLDCLIQMKCHDRWYLMSICCLSARNSNLTFERRVLPDY